MDVISAYGTTMEIMLRAGLSPALTGFKLVARTVVSGLFGSESVGSALKKQALQSNLSGQKAYRAVRSCAEAYARNTGSGALSAQEFIVCLIEQVARACYERDFENVGRYEREYRTGSRF